MFDFPGADMPGSAVGHQSEFLLAGQYSVLPTRTRTWSLLIGTRDLPTLTRELMPGEVEVA